MIKELKSKIEGMEKEIKGLNEQIFTLTNTVEGRQEQLEQY